MSKEWEYGDAWEKYPIKKNQIWIEENTLSKIMVRDLYNGLPYFMKKADMIYTDPPWGSGNLNSFYTKAGMKEVVKEFMDFIDVLFNCIKQINPKVCYLENGKKNADLIVSKMNKQFKYVEKWEITYYKDNPCYLVRGSNYSKSNFDFTGEDDMDTPRLAMENEDFDCVADLCMGRGLIGVTAFEMDKQFMGTELARRRLANLIEKVNKKDGNFRRVFDE